MVIERWTALAKERVHLVNYWVKNEQNSQRKKIHYLELTNEGEIKQSMKVHTKRARFDVVHCMLGIELTNVRMRK